MPSSNEFKTFCVRKPKREEAKPIDREETRDTIEPEKSEAAAAAEKPECDVEKVVAEEKKQDEEIVQATKELAVSEH